MTSSPRPRRVSRRAVLQSLAAVGIGTATGTFAHGFLYARHQLEVTTASIEVTDLPDALSGFRIGFLSDLHRSLTVSHQQIETAVKAVMAERPDVIALGGDYVTWGDRRYVEPSAEALAPLSAPHGVFAVLGNHDDDRDMPSALSARGFTVLRDQRTQLIVRGEKLEIAGIRYWTRRESDIAHVLRGASPHVVLLAHTPMRLHEAAELRVSLLLSGHTHGGQIVLPGIGPFGVRNYPVIAGSGRKRDTAAFVTRGVGTVYLPVRVNCAPEVAILTLKRRVSETEA